MSEKLKVIQPRIRIYFSLIILSFSLLSCSPQKRLHRLLALHPELVANDTIRIQDTTFLPELNIDTIFHYNILKDTLIITKEKLQIKLLQINDTIYFDAYQEPDTIIISKTFPVEKIIYKQSQTFSDHFFEFLKQNRAFSMLILVLFIFFLFRSLKK